MRAHHVRDVEALDPHRDRVEAERLLEPVERLDAAAAAVLGAQPVLVERQARVALGQLEDAALVAALGVLDLDRRAAALAQRERERLGVARRSLGTITCGGTASALA